VRVRACVRACVSVCVCGCVCVCVCGSRLGPFPFLNANERIRSIFNTAHSFVSPTQTLALDHLHSHPQARCFGQHEHSPTLTYPPTHPPTHARTHHHHHTFALPQVHVLDVSHGVWVHDGAAFVPALPP
jgi:hypothetical protein